MSGFLQDVRYGARTLLKSPGFTLVALLALALGIGANSAIFTVVNAVLIRPLPYQDPDRLALVFQTNQAQNWKRNGVSGPNYMDMKEQTRTFADMSLFEPGSGTLTGLGEPEQFPGMRVTANFFTLLGARTHLGRLFTDADAKAGRYNVAVMTYGFWKRRLGGDPTVVGRKFQVDGLSYELIGVLSPDFWFPIASEGFVPWTDEWLRRLHRSNYGFGVLGRLGPGATVEQATSEMNSIMQRIAEKDSSQAGWGALVLPFREMLVEYIRPALLVLLGAVGFVLLIACTNVANLLLARGAGRQKEIAIRATMGAGRWRLVRQMLTESMLLGIAGGGVGLLLAVWGTQLITAVLPHTVPLPETTAQVALMQISVDSTVLLFALGISILTGAIFGLMPAIAMSRTAPVEALKEGGRSSSLSGHATLRSALVVAEVALALVLLAGASLMIRSMLRMQQASPGFQPRHLLTLEMELPTDSKYQGEREWANIYQRFLASIRELPGLESTALTRAVPLGTEQERTFFTVEGRAPASANERLGADLRQVSANYLQTIGVPLIRGRQFTDFDHAEAPPVVIVDTGLARRYWPGQDPIGRRIQMRGRAFEVVGVVGEVKHSGVDHEARPTIYVPYLQVPFFRMAFVVRTAADPASVVRAVKTAVWKIDKGQPVYNAKTMDELMADSASAPRLTLILLGGFAALALLLAAIGIYGVMSYTVSQRRHELGIRVALGAGMMQVLSLVVGRAMLLAVIGVAIGTVAALGLTRVLSSLLFGVSATDPLTFAAVAVILTLVALAASYVPARRAMRVHPIEALRYE